MRRNRSWLRFSLRGMLLAMLVVSAWLAYHANRVTTQRRAIHGIIASESAYYFIFDYQFRDSVVWSNERGWEYDIDANPPGSEWLRSLIGDDWFRTVVGCEMLTGEGIPFVKDLPQVQGSLAIGDARDADLAHLSGLTRLQELNLTQTGNHIRDAGLRYLTGLHSLECLWLSRHATGAGLVHLQDLPRLERIILGPATTENGLKVALRLPHLTKLAISDADGVTDDDLRHLKAQPQLESVMLWGPNISDAGLQHLVGLPNLKTVAIADVPVTDEGVHELRRLPQLTWLTIQRTKIGNTAMGHMAEFPHLERLTLIDVDVSIEGLILLASAPFLNDLSLDGIELTPAQLAALQNAMPNCYIRADR